MDLSKITRYEESILADQKVISKITPDIVAARSLPDHSSVQAKPVTPSDISKYLIGKYKGVEFKYSLAGKQLITTEEGKKLFDTDFSENNLSITRVSKTEFVFTEDTDHTVVPYQPVKHVTKFFNKFIDGSESVHIPTKLISVVSQSSSRDLGYHNKVNGEDFTFIPGKGLFSSKLGSKFYHEKLQGNAKIFITSNKDFVFAEADSQGKALHPGHSVNQIINFLETSKDNDIVSAQREIIGDNVDECLILGD